MLTRNHGVYIWRFPEIGLRASHHPDVHGIFPYKPTGYWGTPMSGNPHIDDPPGAARNASSSASVASTTAPSTRRKVRPAAAGRRAAGGGDEGLDEAWGSWGML